MGKYIIKKMDQKNKLMDIPIDIIYDIIKYLSPIEKWLCMQIPYLSEIYPVNYNVCKNLINYAITHDSIHLFNWGIANGNFIDWKAYMILIKNNKMNFIKKLGNINCEWNNLLFEYAVNLGRVNFVSFFYEKFQDKFCKKTNMKLIDYIKWKSKDITQLAVLSGNIDMIKYIQKKNIFRYTKNILYRSGESGNIDMIKYISNMFKHIEWDSTHFNNAIISGNIDIIKLYLNKVTINKYYIYNSIIYGRFDIMWLLIDHCDTWDDVIFTYIASHNRIDILNDVRELYLNKFSRYETLFGPDRVFGDYYGDIFNIETIEWIKNNNGTINLSLLLKTVCKKGKMDIVKYLINMGEIPDYYCIINSLKLCNKELTEYLLINSNKTIDYNCFLYMYGVKKVKVINEYNLKKIEYVRNYEFSNKHLKFLIWLKDMYFNGYYNGKCFNDKLSHTSIIENESKILTITFDDSIDDIFRYDKKLLKSLEKNGIIIKYKKGMNIFKNKCMWNNL